MTIPIDLNNDKNNLHIGLIRKLKEQGGGL
jgi:hypothetical protein